MGNIEISPYAVTIPRTLKLENYSLKGGVLTIDIPQKISYLIANSAIERIKEVLKFSMRGIVERIEINCILELDLGILYLDRVNLYPKKECKKKEILSIVKTVEKTLQGIIYEKTVTDNYLLN